MEERYGSGHTFTERCQTCGYESDIMLSSGVHVSESGSVKVYCEDDSFFCPNCSKGNETTAETPDLETGL